MDLEIIKKQEIIFPVEINEEAIVALEKNLAPELIPEDLTVKENYELVVAKIRQGRESKGAIAKHVKLLKEETIAYNKKVNGLGNSLTTRVVGAVTPWKETKTSFDTAAEIAKREKIRIEEERIDKISTRIAEIGALVSGNIQSNSDILGEVISDLKKEISTEWAGEFAEKAKSTILETKDKLLNLLDMKIQAEQAEEIIAKAEEERAKKEDEDRIEQARIAEENQKVAAKLKADQDALEEKRLAEQQKMADAANKLKADQDKFEADKQAEIDRQEEVKRKEEEIKAEAERLARIEEQRVKDQAEKAEAEEKKLAQIEKFNKETAAMAEQNLGQAIKGTIQGLKLAFPVNTVPTDFFEAFIQDVRSGNFTHLAWVD